MVICYIAIENDPVEIVDLPYLPSYKMVICHSYVTVYQRVMLLESMYTYLYITVDGFFKVYDSTSCEMCARVLKLMVLYHGSTIRCFG
jgi:hypothetical protein